MQAKTLKKEVTPPKQARSRARKAALIEQGIAALEHHELDEISIIDLTKSLGYSTGSFYSYFQNKTLFFVNIQEWVGAEQSVIINDRLRPERVLSKSLVERLEMAVDIALVYFRKYTGVIRSALRYERRIPQAWAPNRAATQKVILAVTLGLDENQQYNLKKAIQLAYGLIVNALLHNPGPLALNDKNLETELLGVLTPYLAENEHQST